MTEILSRDNKPSSPIPLCFDPFVMGISGCFQFSFLSVFREQRYCAGIVYNA